MKKVISLILLFVMVFALSGCDLLSSEKELVCVEEGEEIMKVVYKKDEIISVYEEGYTYTEDEIDEINGDFLDEWDAEDFFEGMEEVLAELNTEGYTCEIK